MLVTIFPVAVAIVAYYAALRLKALSDYKLQMSLLLLLGVWVTGSFLIMVGASFTGGGYTQDGTLTYLLKSIYLFPAHTFMASTYDGTLGALFIVTIWLLCLFTINIVRKFKKRTQQRTATDG